MFVSSSMLLVLFGVVLMAVLGLVYWLWSRSAARKRGLWQEQQSTVELLQEALESRAVFNIRFEAEAMRERFLRGPCVAVGKDKVLIDANITYGIPSWAGQKVQVYFSLSSAKSSVFYEFHTSIARTVPYLGNVGIEMFIPDRLVRNQRRAFVRFSPPQRFVAGIRLWTGRVTRALDGLVPNTAPSPSLDGDALSLDNISAGGLRVVFPSRAYDAVAPEDGAMALVNLVLRNSEGQETLNLWCATTVVQECRENNRTLLSLKFERWAPESEPDAPISWFPVGREGGVPPLAAWVMRRQLEVECRSN